LASAAYIGLSLSGAAVADDDEQFKQARSNGMYYMESRSYAQAEAEFLKAARASSRSSRAWMYKHAGDAAFLQGNYDVARRHYALGIATRFERDLWITRENPGWAQAVSGENPVERAPLTLPRLGGPNEAAPLPRKKKYYLEPLPAPRSKHTEEDRKRVKQISRQLTSAAKKASRGVADPFAVDPLSRGVPGSGIARVVTSSGVCPAVRSTQGSYIASASCLTATGVFPPTPWTLMHESGLHQPDVCQVDDYWTVEGKNPSARAANMRENWAVLAVQSDCHAFLIEMIPFILVNRPAPPLGTGRLATVEYSDLHDQRVAMLQFCGDAFGRACGDGLRYPAAVWTELGEETDGLRIGQWRFAGFIEPGGELVDFSTSPHLVGMLEKAWDLGHRRRVQAEVEEKAVAR
jgi:hypothetical protein